MINQLKKLNSITLRKTNFKAFSFFLIFSVVVWIFVQFSKPYQEILQVKLAYNNPPNDKIVTQKKGEIPVRITENGFGLLWYAIFTPSLAVNLEELPYSDKELHYIIKNQEKSIVDKLQVDFNQLTFLKDTLKIPYQKKAVRKVAVTPQMTINYVPGYASGELVKLKPDSIKISGRKEVIDTIQQIKTIYIELNDVKENRSGTLKLDTTGIGNVTFYKQVINYTVKVEKFTEGRVEVPIEVLNAPENITIFPKTAVVVFKTSLDNYPQISKNSFRVVCDYSKVDKDQNFMIPKIKKQPLLITASRVNLNKVEFVLKK